MLIHQIPQNATMSMHTASYIFLHCAWKYYHEKLKWTILETGMKEQPKTCPMPWFKWKIRSLPGLWTRKNATKFVKKLKKCWDPKNLRTFEAQPIFTGSYKKKSVVVNILFLHWKLWNTLNLFYKVWSLSNNCLEIVTPVLKLNFF